MIVDVIAHRVLALGFFILASPLTAGDMAIERIDARGFPVVRVQFVVPGTTVEKPVLSTEVRVMEDGKDVGVVSLALQRDPLAIEMVVDESGSMTKDMDSLKRAATTFVDEMPENTKVGLVSFSSDVKKLEDVVGDRHLLRKAIARLDPYGATALFDGIMEGFHQLDRVEKTAIPTRKVMLVFTDGRDQDEAGKKPQSRATVKEVVLEARRRGVPLYMIGLGAQVNTDLMKKMALMAGGRYFHAPRSSDLAGIYREVARLLGVSYSAAYRTPREAADGTRRTVVVECLAKGLAGNAHGAYKAPSTPVVAPVAYHATVENSRGEAVPQLTLYAPYRITGTTSASGQQLVAFEQRINTAVGPIWSEATILSYQSARLALLESREALHRARLLAHKSLLAADRALKEAERVVAISAELDAEARALVEASMKLQVEERRRVVEAYRAQVLAYHNAWAKAVGQAAAESIEMAATASQTASGLTLEATELTRAGLEVGLEGARIGVEASRIGLEAGAAGLEAGAEGLEAGAAGLEAGRDAIEAGAATLEAGQAGFDAAREALQGAGSSLEAAREALDGAEDAVEGAQEMVEEAGTGILAPGGAAERVNNAQERVQEALQKLGGNGDWIE